MSQASSSTASTASAASRAGLLALLGFVILVETTELAGQLQQAPPPQGGQAQPGQTGGRGQGGQAGQPTRDNPAQTQSQTAAPAATGRITGRVVAADTGRPLRGARVAISAPQVSGRSLVTDATGQFTFTALPDGRYSLSVSKNGFINLSYGQRRPLQPGTPLQLTGGQRLEGIEMRVPRGSAITGHVMDENGDPLPNLMVRVTRFQYQQGERRLVPAGGAQTDDRGQYRVWGLNPGDYYVSAVMPNLGGILDQLGGLPIGPGGRGGPGGGPGNGGPGGPGGPGGRGQGGDPAQGGGRGGRGAAPGQGGVAAGRGFDVSALVNNALSDPSFASALSAAGLGNVAMMLGPQDNADPVAYAPTYFPGVSSAAEARPITVPLGGEAQGIDFSLLLVQTSKVGGHLMNPDGSPAAGGNVNMFPDQPGGGGRGGMFGETFSGRVQTDGAFTISNVPPGRYILRARGGNTGGGRGGGRGGRGAAAGAAPTAQPPQLFASQSITVSGGDAVDLMIPLAPGATVTGTISLPPAQTGTSVNLAQVRVNAQATDSSLGTNIATNVQPDGTFKLENVPAGTHWFRGQAPRGLTLTAVTIGGRNVIDDPYEVRSGDDVGGVTLVFTDKVSEINGTVTDSQGAPITDYTVLAYSEDSRLWRPQSRQIATARPDQNGKFQIRGLPPGRYYVATVDPEVQGEWFESDFLEQHRAGAASLSLGDGEVKTQDFKIR